MSKTSLGRLPPKLQKPLRAPKDLSDKAAAEQFQAEALAAWAELATYYGVERQEGSTTEFFAALAPKLLADFVPAFRWIRGVGGRRAGRRKLDNWSAMKALLAERRARPRLSDKAFCAWLRRYWRDNPPNPFGRDLTPATLRAYLAKAAKEEARLTFWADVLGFNAPGLSAKPPSPLAFFAGPGAGPGQLAGGGLLDVPKVAKE